MDITLVYSQETKENDGRSFINLEGDKILIVSQNQYKTLQILDVETQVCLWYVNIPGHTIHARPSATFEIIIVSYIIDESNQRTLYIVEYDWVSGNSRHLFSKDDVVGIYSSCPRCISYSKNNSSYILTFDRNYRQIKESQIIGQPYDLNLVHNGLVYLNYSSVLGVPYVSLVFSKVEETINIPYGRDVICYITITRHPLKNVSWVVVSVNGKSSSNVYIYKIKDNITLKYRDEIKSMKNISYCYLNRDCNKLLVSGSNDKTNDINVYDIEKEERSYGFSNRKWFSKVYRTMQTIPKGYWILNHNDDFNHIVMTNARSTKNNVIAMSNAHQKI